MKKLVQLLLVTCVLIWSTCVFAVVPGNGPVQSPESMITCGSGNQEHPVVVADISVSLNMEQCELFEDNCAPCISSLENQGCKFIDVIVTHPLANDVGVPSMTSYLLSCDGR
jgi:hypothetical protein